MYRDDEKRFGIRNDYYDQLKVLMKNPESGDSLHPDDILFEIVNDPSEEKINDKNIRMSEIKNDEIDDNVIQKVLYSTEKSNYSSADFMIIFGCHIKSFLDERIKFAVLKFKNKNISKIIISGGVGVKGDFNESQYMLEKLLQKGIKRDDIIVEDKSTTTEENIINCLEIIKKNCNDEPVNILLISQQPHLKRIVSEFEKYDLSKNINIFIDWPDDSILSFENVIKDQELKRMVINEVSKILRFVREGIINDEMIQLIE